MEIPGGKIWVEGRPPGRSKRWRKFRNIQSGKIFYKIVTNPKREIHFRPDPELIDPPPKPKRQPKKRRKPRKVRVQTPAPSPPASVQPWTPREEIVALYRQLTGVDPGFEDMDLMLALCGEQGLLMRLRYLAEQEREYKNPRQLIAALGRLVRMGW